MKLNNQRVLITGGGSGIGLALAQTFLKNGSSVTITGRKEDKLKKVCEENQGLKYQVCDVTDDDQIKQLKSDIETAGGINVLINNAGIFNEVDYNSEASLEEQMNEIDIDFNGPIRMTHHFLPMLKNEKNSAIVNVSSGLAFVPLTVAPVYCGTKAGIHSWTQSLRFQLNGKIKVFELMPPLTDTPMIKDEWKKFKPIPVSTLVSGFEKGFTSDKYEIVVGQSKGLRKMSRWAPSFIFKQVNKTFVNS